MSNKYIIKNCPAILRITQICDDYRMTRDNPQFCKNITDCPLKQIVEKCKKTVKIFSAESGTQPYAGGRCTEAEGILQILDIQEVE